MKKIYLLSILFVFSAVSFSQTFLNSNRDKDGRNYFSFNYQPLLTRSVNQITPDWIYDTKAPILSSLKSADVDGDGIKEIIISTYDTTDGNSYGAGLIYILNIDGTDLDGWPLRMVGAPIPATVSIGDINNDDSLELVVGSWNKLYVYDSQGNNVPGFPKNYGTSQTSTLFDLDKDGTLEIIYPSDDKNLYIFKYDGTLLTGWPQSLTELPGSPAVADIDNDGEYEIVAGTFKGPVGPDPFKLYAWEIDGNIINGFPVSLSGVIKSTPAIGDLDNDGTKEIVVISYDDTNDDSLYVFDAGGNLKTGFPVGVRYARLSSPALGDIDGDGDLEILVGGLDNSTEMLYGFHHDGSVIQNFPVPLNHPGSVTNINNSPVIGDIDGDTTSVEIIVKANDYIFAIHQDSTLVNGFPYFIDDENQSATHSPSPLIDDFDNDGDVEYVFASIPGKIHFFDPETAYNKNFEFWNSYKHDMQNTGAIFSIPIFTDVDEINSAVPSEFILSQNYPNPFNPSTKIKFTIAKSPLPGGDGRGGLQFVKLVVYDLLGNEVATLVNEEKPAGTYEVEFDASRLSSGIYFYQLQAGSLIETKKMILLR
ncbi:FG-GAP repeat protein [bacterium BMS3Abin03]|nr:FG-GAP repeat protein [bacterium BMS3Abin03]HDZ59138.1 T9SS type A sorting domain-containing protein [Ignavibacteriales bacterium]